MTNDPKTLKARLRELATQIDPLLLGGPDARLLNEAADALDQRDDRIKTLEAAIRDYLREHDNPAPDYAFRHHQRERMRAALNGGDGK